MPEESQDHAIDALRYAADALRQGAITQRDFEQARDLMSDPPQVTAMSCTSRAQAARFSRWHWANQSEVIRHREQAVAQMIEAVGVPEHYFDANPPERLDVSRRSLRIHYRRNHHEGGLRENMRRFEQLCGMLCQNEHQAEMDHYQKGTRHPHDYKLPINLWDSTP